MHHIPSLQVPVLTSSTSNITLSGLPNQITTSTAISASTNNVNNTSNIIVSGQTQHPTTPYHYHMRSSSGNIHSNNNNSCNIGSGIGIGVGANSAYRTQTQVDTTNMDHHHQFRHLSGGVNIVFDENNVNIFL